MGAAQDIFVSPTRDGQFHCASKIDNVVFGMRWKEIRREATL